MTNFKLLSLFIVTTMLVACGGGGGDAPSDGAADKFVGTWSACSPTPTPIPGVISIRADYVITKTGSSSLSISLDGVGFSAAGCTGTQVNKVSGIATGTIILNGTKVIGSQTVDRLNNTLVSATPSLNGSFKDIALVSGNTLNFGAISPVDADGYPTQIDTANPFIKQ
jgi:hypothetical protein